MENEKLIEYATQTATALDEQITEYKRNDMMIKKLEEPKNHISMSNEAGTIILTSDMAEIEVDELKSFIKRRFEKKREEAADKIKVLLKIAEVAPVQPSDTIAEETQKEAAEQEKKKEAPAPNKRKFTTDVISDEKLREEYFKNGLKVREISEKYDLAPSGLYKRLENLKKEIKKTEKELARQ